MRSTRRRVLPRNLAAKVPRTGHVAGRRRYLLSSVHHRAHLDRCRLGPSGGTHGGAERDAERNGRNECGGSQEILLLTGAADLSSSTTRGGQVRFPAAPPSRPRSTQNSSRQVVADPEVDYAAAAGCATRPDRSSATPRVTSQAGRVFRPAAFMQLIPGIRLERALVERKLRVLADPLEGQETTVSWSGSGSSHTNVYTSLRRGRPREISPRTWNASLCGGRTDATDRATTAVTPNRSCEVSLHPRGRWASRAAQSSDIWLAQPRSGKHGSPTGSPAPILRAGGRRFDPGTLHHRKLDRLCSTRSVGAPVPGQPGPDEPLLGGCTRARAQGIRSRRAGASAVGPGPTRQHVQGVE